MLDRLFALKAHGTSVGTEVLAGVTTFLTMAYIVVVNPLILGDAGMPVAGVAVATCLAAAFGSIVMGLVANVPLALAPGMGPEHGREVHLDGHGDSSCGSGARTGPVVLV